MTEVGHVTTCTSAKNEGNEDRRRHFFGRITRKRLWLSVNDVALTSGDEGIVYLDFSVEEKDFYSALFERSKTKFDSFVAQGYNSNFCI